METRNTKDTQANQGLAGRAVGIKAGFKAGYALAGARDEQTIEAQKCLS